MLPVHVVPSPHSSVSTAPYAALATDEAGHQGTSSSLDPLIADGTGGMYPPRTPASSGSRHGINNAGYPTSGAGSSTGVLGRVFGRRGIASLTVDVAAPSSSRSEATNSNARCAGGSGLPTGTETQKTASGQRDEVTPKPSRWGTWEFRLYYLAFVTVVPYMVWVPIKLSERSNPNFFTFRPHLEKGWLFGRLRDDSDFQYRSFRDYVPVLTGIVVIYLALSALFSRLGQGAGYQALMSSRKPNREAFLFLFTTVFIVALHGVNSLKLLAALLLNFTVAKVLAGRRYVAPLFIWTLNVGMLAAVHWNDGFQWQHLGNGSLRWLEQYGGLLPRWQINFNISMLRLVSFSLDLHWAHLASPPPSLAAPDLSQGEEDGQTNNRKRAAVARPLHEYSLGNYLLYVLYPPLFIAGPIMSFNDFVSQLTHPPSIPVPHVARYLVRFLVSLLSMEFVLHYMYVNAIKDTHAWKGETPMQLSMVGFWNLIIVWLKLLIPWRFFRLWALADGVDPPENMIRCMANNYSTLGFWRSWHRSYNLWIVRYIYIPVGGSRNTYGLPATLLVFTFVALWHDLSLKLLTWGWLVVLFLVPEIFARYYLLPAEKYGERWWYRHVCALGAVGNILLMMTANLVGFVLGVDGIKYMWTQLLGTIDGLTFFLGACAALFIAAQVMFEYREEELRRGISRKC